MLAITISFIITITIFFVSSFIVESMKKNNKEVALRYIVYYLVINCISYGLFVIILWENYLRNIIRG